MTSRSFANPNISSPASRIPSIIRMPYHASRIVANDRNIRVPMPMKVGSCVDSKLVIACCTVPIGSYPRFGPMVVSLVRSPCVERRGRVTEEVGAVRLAIAPLMDRGVHQAGLGVALPLAVDQLLFERTQEELVCLLTFPQLNRIRGGEFFQQCRLGVIVVTAVGGVRLDVIDGLLHLWTLGAAEAGLIDRQSVRAVREFERRVAVGEAALHLRRHAPGDATGDIERIRGSAIPCPGRVALIQCRDEWLRVQQSRWVVAIPIARVAAVSRCHVDRQTVRLREEELILLQELLVRSDRFGVVRRVVHDPLRVDGPHYKRGAERRSENCEGGSFHCAPSCRSSYAGNAKSFMR